jgi:hypothetical protein
MVRNYEKFEMLQVYRSDKSAEFGQEKSQPLEGALGRSTT